jgi:hypothetical protein
MASEVEMLSGFELKSVVQHWNTIAEAKNLITMTKISFLLLLVLAFLLLVSG